MWKTARSSAAAHSVPLTAGDRRIVPIDRDGVRSDSGRLRQRLAAAGRTPWEAGAVAKTWR